MTFLAQDAPQSNRRNTNSDPDEIVVSEWPLNKRESARVSLCLYRGTWLINLRKWFETDDGQLRPGKGFALGVKHLPRVAETTAKALSVARERGLIERSNHGSNTPDAAGMPGVSRGTAAER